MTKGEGLLMSQGVQKLSTMMIDRRLVLSLIGVGAFAPILDSVPALALGQKVRIASFEYLSGPFAAVGQTAAAVLKEVIALQNANSASPVQIELSFFDTKGSVQEVQTSFNHVVDQGIRYITGGGNSAGAAYLVEAVSRHNSRNPGKEILYFNHQCLDPDLTNSKCSFWHFRFGPNVLSRVDALTRYLADDKATRSVILRLSAMNSMHSAK